MLLAGHTVPSHNRSLQSPGGGTRGPPRQGALGTPSALWATLPTGKAFRSRTRTRPAPTPFLQTLQGRGSENHVVNCAMSKTMVWATRPHSHLAQWCLHVETGPKEKWRLSRTGPGGRGWGTGRGVQPCHATRGMALACPCAARRARVPRAFRTLVFKVLVPARLGGRASGVRGRGRHCFPLPQPAGSASMPAWIQQKGLRGKLATVPAAA